MLAALAPPLAAATVRVLGATQRVRASGIEPLLPMWRSGQPLIYAVWHGRILMVPWMSARLRRTRGARPVQVLASRSRDGELVARYVRRFGLGVVRGSSSRGGAAALRALARTLRAGDDVAVVPDGPRGPRAGSGAGTRCWCRRPSHAARWPSAPPPPSRVTPTASRRARAWSARSTRSPPPPTAWWRRDLPALHRRPCRRAHRLCARRPRPPPAARGTRQSARAFRPRRSSARHAADGVGARGVGGGG